MSIRRSLLSGVVLLSVLGAGGIVAAKGRLRSKLFAPKPLVAASAVAQPPAPPAAVPSVARVEFPGVLLAPQSVDISPHMEGKLAKVKVRMGDRITAGQVLAQMDGRSLKQELAIAQSLQRAAHADAGRAGADFAGANDRRKRRTAVVMFEGQSIPIVSAEEASGSKYDAQSAGARASSAVAHAKGAGARVEQLKIDVEQMDLRAPFDGFVTTVFIDAGTHLKPGTPVVRVMSTAGLRVRFAVPEESTARAKVNALLDVVVDETRHLGARVEKIAPEIEPASRTLFVEATITSGTSEEERAVLAGRVAHVAFQ